MIIWGWGKVSKKSIGPAFQRACNYCNSTEIWQLYIIRTWFTLFFIPVIPYNKRYCVACPNCGSYIELTKEEFEKMRLDITSASNGTFNTDISYVENSLKYEGKTETQRNYLKQIEEMNNNNSN